MYADEHVPGRPRGRELGTSIVSRSRPIAPRRLALLAALLISALCGCEDILGLQDPTLTLAANCSDGTRNGTETDIDCGGADCPACMDSQACEEASDCTTGVCQEGSCLSASCGDEIVSPAIGEDCDEGGVDTAACDRDCSLPECGDGLVNSQFGEQCDPPLQNGCSESCELLCGNGSLDPGEDLDPPPGPLQSAPVDALTCRYDLSAIPQLYCSGTCGLWGGGEDCQQADADVLCKLQTGNPMSTALSFEVAEALAEPGFCCLPTVIPPSAVNCAELGNMASRGVDLDVALHDTDLVSTHGSGDVVTNVTCSDP